MARWLKFSKSSRQLWKACNMKYILQNHKGLPSFSTRWDHTERRGTSYHTLFEEFYDNPEYSYENILDSSPPEDGNMIAWWNWHKLKAEHLPKHEYYPLFLEDQFEVEFQRGQVDFIFIYNDHLLLMELKPRMGQNFTDRIDIELKSGYNKSDLVFYHTLFEDIMVREMVLEKALLQKRIRHALRDEGLTVKDMARKLKSEGIYYWGVWGYDEKNGVIGLANQRSLSYFKKSFAIELQELDNYYEFEEQRMRIRSGEELEEDEEIIPLPMLKSPGKQCEWCGVRPYCIIMDDPSKIPGRDERESIRRTFIEAFSQVDNNKIDRQPEPVKQESGYW